MSLTVSNNQFYSNDEFDPGIFTQVSDSGPRGPLVFFLRKLSSFLKLRPFVNLHEILWPWVDHDLCFRKDKFGPLGFWIGKSEKVHFSVVVVLSDKEMYLKWTCKKRKRSRSFGDLTSRHLSVVCHYFQNILSLKLPCRLHLNYICSLQTKGESKFIYFSRLYDRDGPMPKYLLKLGWHWHIYDKVRGLRVLDHFYPTWGENMKIEI